MAATKKKQKKAAAKKKKAPAKKAPASKKKKKATAKPAPKKKAKAKAKANKAAQKPKKAKPKDVLPTAEEEARFWSLLEDAWATQSKEVNDARIALSKRKPSSDDDDDDDDDVDGLDLVDDALDSVMESLKEVFAFEEFPKEELIAMDRVLERKLYDIDRQEIQEVTDGSDDGFLYARGYIVALGKDFYDAVNKNPKMAIMDAECEEMCYLPAHVYSERFGGEFPETGAKISRESCSNQKAWPELFGGDDRRQNFLE